MGGDSVVSKKVFLRIAVAVDERKAVNVRCASEDRKFQAVGYDLIRRWLKSTGSTPAPGVPIPGKTQATGSNTGHDSVKWNPANLELHGKLEIILNRAGADVADLIAGNIDVFHENTAIKLEQCRVAEVAAVAARDEKGGRDNPPGQQANRKAKTVGRKRGPADE